MMAHTHASTPTIVVFGGSGFLGTYVVQALATIGFRVKIVCRNPNAASSMLTSAPLGNISVVAGNVRSRECVARHVKGAYGVVNLVAALYERKKQGFQSLHVDAAETIAQEAAKHGVRTLVHVSALAVDKAAKLRPASRYALTKLEGEQRVRAAFPSAVILRPSVLFGPEDQFFNRFAALAKLLHVLPAIGGGRSLFQPVYVGDVAHAIAACFQRDDARGETYELGGPQMLSMRDIYSYILSKTRLRALIVPLPWRLASIIGGLCSLSPFAPPITHDQVRLLRVDNVRTQGSLGLLHLGVPLTPIEAIVPEYLALYK